jgi:hypothetical protein
VAVRRVRRRRPRAAASRRRARAAPADHAPRPESTPRRGSCLPCTPGCVAAIAASTWSARA